MYMTYFVTITSQGQISIPADIRRKFQLDKKRNLLIRTEGDKIILTPETDISDLKGILKTKKLIPYQKARKAFEEALARGEV